MYILVVVNIQLLLVMFLQLCVLPVHHALKLPNYFSPLSSFVNCPLNILLLDLPFLSLQLENSSQYVKYCFGQAVLLPVFLNQHIFPLLNLLEIWIGVNYIQVHLLFLLQLHCTDYIHLRPVLVTDIYLNICVNIHGLLYNVLHYIFCLLSLEILVLGYLKQRMLL